MTSVTGGRAFQTEEMVCAKVLRHGHAGLLERDYKKAERVESGEMAERSRRRYLGEVGGADALHP